MNYICFTFQSTDEIFLAYLAQLPFESMVEENECTLAYISEESLTIEIEKEISNLSSQFNVVLNKTIEPKTNWNQVWESSFQPVEVDDFVRVRADFHANENRFQHEIIINPKMSFGTGHHETTFMMIKMMNKLAFGNKHVLDYGSGTGILAILASKLGSNNVWGVDIEEWAFENSNENKDINNTREITFLHGTMNNVPLKKFDIILANITKNILLESVEEIDTRSTNGTDLLLSGILSTQREEIVNKYNTHQFTLIEELNKGKWVCLHLQKTKYK